ncbi:hypothetical protein [Sorangium sp. So ce388]|uniref:hypothetical protein n=1 Tax=Sorangium sp. So ce388 TaxID=3133309 RepID=UPI003F5B1643
MILSERDALKQEIVAEVLGRLREALAPGAQGEPPRFVTPADADEYAKRPLYDEIRRINGQLRGGPGTYPVERMYAADVVSGLRQAGWEVSEPRDEYGMTRITVSRPSAP